MDPENVYALKKAGDYYFIIKDYEKAIDYYEKLVRVDPGNIHALQYTADYYLGIEDYKKAIHAYENVIRIDPENVHALNNLAWVFATCSNPEYKNKTAALDLASRALALKRESFVLDTYAEALYMNQDIENAVAAAREAKALAKDKKEYYQSQLLKFQGKSIQN
ncbi:MAG: tetratricopeptide repeat protein [Desulfobacteraceae bacterium]|nr:tetratricopeptide repeat protein [Desulfobacteraceae bacterium]